MFVKIDKKILIISVILLILILVFGFVSYKYLFRDSYRAINEPSGQKIEQSNPSLKFNPQNQGVELKEANNIKGLTVCLDKCGDGICQKKDPNCEDENLNCVCAEDYEDCLKDCPNGQK